MTTCPQPILDLVEYLRLSGTGKAKLEKILEIGSKSEGPEEFLENLKGKIPDLTLEKVLTYIDSLNRTNPTETVGQPDQKPEPSSQEGPQTKEVEEVKEEVQEEAKEEVKPRRKR